jgi:hypothetical protein|tara:strand:+ start:1929 stop:2060 length:132 start_codon:yes stop_codon:yes gene_type:complete
MAFVLRISPYYRGLWQGKNVIIEDEFFDGIEPELGYCTVSNIR